MTIEEMEYQKLANKSTRKVSGVRHTRWNGTISFIFILLYLKAASSNTVSITSGFEKRTLDQGENFTLQCTANGLYHVTITWLLDGLALEYQNKKSSESVRFTADNPHAPNKNDVRNSAVANSRYLIRNSNKPDIDVTPEDNQNNPGKKNSSTQAVSVVDKIDIPSLAGDPPADDIFLPLLSPSDVESETSGVTITSELTLDDASVEDGGVYTCVARDVLRESVSWSSKISVLGPISIRQNPPIFALIDSVVIIPCTVLGTDRIYPVRWYYRKFLNSGDAEDSQWIALPNDHRQTVHANGSLEIRDARKSNEGIYKCQVDMLEKLDNMTTRLKVMVPPKIKPFALPEVRVGETVGEFCLVSEGDLPLDISWHKNGKLLSIDDVQMHNSGKRALSFAINSVSLKSAGNYTCCAKNNVSRTCVVSTLTVLDAPKITGLASRISVISGNHVTVPCHATGFPQPNVTWMRVMDDSSSEYKAIPKIKDGHSLVNSTVRLGQFRNGTLLMANVSSSQGGKYLCRAVNKVDELSRFVTVQVNNPARIIDLTGTRDVVYGSDIIIQCVVWGDAVVETKWFEKTEGLMSSEKYEITNRVAKNRLVDYLHSVTLSKLIIRNSSRSDTGSFSCQVRNEYGSAVRHIDILVRAPPSLPSKFEVIDKGTSFLRVLVSPGEDDGGSKLLTYNLSYVEIPDEEDSAAEEPARTDSGPSNVEREFTMVKFPASASGGDQELVLDHLECGKQYELRITTENAIGQSFGELDIRTSTIGSEPVIPAVNELVVETNQSSAVLDLRAWQNGGCPITALTIEYARHGDTEWNVTVVDDALLKYVLSSAHGENEEKGAKNPGHVILSNLQIGTWYKIWTSACNNAGCNYVTHSVATLLKDGSTVPPLITEIEKKNSTHGTDARYLVPMVCGFGLVLLLVVLLVFYRHKQQSEKHRRMKEAKRMTNSLLYKTDKKQYSARRNQKYNDQADSNQPGHPNTHVADNMPSSVTLPTMEIACVTANTSTEECTEEFPSDAATAGGDATTPIIQNATLHNGSAPLPSLHSNRSSKSSSEGSNTEAKKSLSDKAELAVFRDDACSDEEIDLTSPLVSDESAFSDAGTWSYFHPNSKTLLTKYSPVATSEGEGEAPSRRSSSASSSTDEELAEAFGLTSSRNEFIPVAKERPVDAVPQSAVKNRQENKRNIQYNINGINSTKSQKRQTELRPSPRGVSHHPKPMNQYYTVGGVHNRQGLPRPVGVLGHPRPRGFHQLPGNSSHLNQRPSITMKQRHLHPNHNPFRPGNLHRQVDPAPKRGHTYSHAIYPQFPILPPKGYVGEISKIHKAPVYDNSSPFGERHWVDTYDSQYGTARSKRPSWGSTDLDKEAFYTPPSSNVSAQCEGETREKSPGYPFETGQNRMGDVNDNHIDLCARNDRKLISDSPRDSGIGSDDAPSSVQSPGSAPTFRAKGPAGRSPCDVTPICEIRSSAESPTESSPSPKNHETQSDSGILESKSEEMLYSGEDDFVFPISPPPSPPEQETRLAPHIFVNTSACNTTPTRASRSSYPPSLPVPSRPPYGNNNNSCDYLARTVRRGDCMPTPPPSGPTSPADPKLQSRQFRPQSSEGGAWHTANLDHLNEYHKHQHKSDSQLPEEERERKARQKGNSDFSDTTYALLNDDSTWLASTLV